MTLYGGTGKPPGNVKMNFSQYLIPSDMRDEPVYAGSPAHYTHHVLCYAARAAPDPENCPVRCRDRRLILRRYMVRRHHRVHRGVCRTIAELEHQRLCIPGIF